MSNTKKVKTALDACRQLSKSLRDQIDNYKKGTELSPKQAGLKVAKSILIKIKEHEENLKKMESLEKMGEVLNKTTPPDVPEDVVYKLKEQYGYGTPAEKAKVHATAWKIHKDKKGKKAEKAEASESSVTKNEGAAPGMSVMPPKSQAQLANKFMGKSVFDKLGKTAEKSTSDETETSAHPRDNKAAQERAKGAKLPGDVEPKKVDAKDTGSGGQIKPAKKLKKGESPILSKSLTVASNPMVKALPKLGGKDQASTQMTQHAFMAAGQEDKNKKMPTGQQSTKMPSPGEHTQRASTFEEHMPKGKFSKTEWKSEKCSYCKGEMHEGNCK
jgi:hypothetical protein